VLRTVHIVAADTMDDVLREALPPEYAQKLPRLSPDESPDWRGEAPASPDTPADAKAVSPSRD
jgi:hypothetical protein